MIWRYHLDSDHSSHDERPEEAVSRLLAGPTQPQSSIDSASDSNNPDLEVNTSFKPALINIFIWNFKYTLL